jgi:hypothetical protein
MPSEATDEAAVVAPNNQFMPEAQVQVFKIALNLLAALVLLAKLVFMEKV